MDGKVWCKALGMAWKPMSRSNILQPTRITDHRLPVQPGRNTGKHTPSLPCIQQGFPPGRSPNTGRDWRASTGPPALSNCLVGRHTHPPHGKQVLRRQRIHSRHRPVAPTVPDLQDNSRARLFGCSWVCTSWLRSECMHFACIRQTNSMNLDPRSLLYEWYLSGLRPQCPCPLC